MNSKAVDKILMNLDATSMHQSVEWGMSSQQKSFPWIKDIFVYEEKGERKIMLKIIIYSTTYKQEWWRLIRLKIFACLYWELMQMKKCLF